VIEISESMISGSMIWRSIGLSMNDELGDLIAHRVIGLAELTRSELNPMRNHAIETTRSRNHR
jgi:hypothetical protein